MNRERPYPHLLSEDEKLALLQKAESLWEALQENKSGGFSGINRPFLILHEFKEVIEKYGQRDVGLAWSLNDLRKSLEAFERWAKSEKYELAVIASHYDDSSTQCAYHGWQASRSAFAAELVRRLEADKTNIGSYEYCRAYDTAVDKAIAIIRQMAGEK